MFPHERPLIWLLVPSLTRIFQLKIQITLSVVENLGGRVLYTTGSFSANGSASYHYMVEFLVTLSAPWVFKLLGGEWLWVSEIVKKNEQNWIEVPDFLSTTGNLECTAQSVVCSSTVYLLGRELCKPFDVCSTFLVPILSSLFPLGCPTWWGSRKTLMEFDLTRRQRHSGHVTPWRSQSSRVGKARLLVLSETKCKYKNVQLCLF